MKSKEFELNEKLEKLKSKGLMCVNVSVMNKDISREELADSMIKMIDSMETAKTLGV